MLLKLFINMLKSPNMSDEDYVGFVREYIEHSKKLNIFLFSISVVCLILFVIVSVLLVQLGLFFVLKGYSGLGACLSIGSGSLGGLIFITFSFGGMFRSEKYISRINRLLLSFIKDISAIKPDNVQCRKILDSIYKRQRRNRISEKYLKPIGLVFFILGHILLIYMNLQVSWKSSETAAEFYYSIATVLFIYVVFSLFLFPAIWAFGVAVDGMWNIKKQRLLLKYYNEEAMN